MVDEASRQNWKNFWSYVSGSILWKIQKDRPEIEEAHTKIYCEYHGTHFEYDGQYYGTMPSINILQFIWFWYRNNYFLTQYSQFFPRSSLLSNVKFFNSCISISSILYPDLNSIKYDWTFVYAAMLNLLLFSPSEYNHWVAYAIEVNFFPCNRTFFL